MFELFADYHTHTRHSHGTGTVLDNVQAARKRGLSEVAITDHGPGSLPWIGVRGGPDKLRAIARETRHYTQVFGDIRVLVGVECNVMTLEGELDVTKPVLKELDLTLCGLHPLVVPPTLHDAIHLFGLNTAGRYSRRLARRSRVANTKALTEAVRRYDVDIVTHPGLKLSIDTRTLASVCADRGTALELNAAHSRMTVEYARVAAREGCLFAIDSDAHRPEDVGRLAPAIAVARAAGLTADQIINARAPGQGRISPGSDELQTRGQSSRGRGSSER
ncbi:MAG: PHP domain-containing protein [Chloroflexota bacterium]